ncbi:hypothetical protein LZ30DRAFT_308175 [Colletotrichum cereale]|nr:hypothetical protein LZ30DRAFT_308175 [Colletotrichum cereale]
MYVADAASANRQRRPQYHHCYYYYYYHHHCYRHHYHRYYYYSCCFLLLLLLRLCYYPYCYSFYYYSCLNHEYVCTVYDVAHRPLPIASLVREGAPTNLLLKPTRCLCTSVELGRVKVSFSVRCLSQPSLASLPACAKRPTPKLGRRCPSLPARNWRRDMTGDATPDSSRQDRLAGRKAWYQSGAGGGKAATPCIRTLVFPTSPKETGGVGWFMNLQTSYLISSLSLSVSYIIREPGIIRGVEARPFLSLLPPPSLPSFGTVLFPFSSF